MKSSAAARLRFISYGLVALTLLLVARLYYLQVIHGDEYALRAERQYATSSDGIFDRGSIMFQDKNGNQIAAATLKSGFTLAINPSALKEPEVAYEKLNALLPIDREIFLSKAGKVNDPHEEITKRVPSEIGAKIEALEIPGVNLYSERWRYYPGEKLLANVLGFVGYQDDVLSGQYGLERYYNDILIRNNSGLYKNFFAEIFSGLETAVDPGGKFEGDIVTTIEPTVQAFLEKSLGGVEKIWHSKTSGGIIINPKTGEIYALAVNPTFNPNTFQTETDHQLFTNPTVESVYEMGSIIKPLTMAAGLDAGVVTAATTYNDAGSLTLDGKKISNYDGKGRGVVSMQEVLNQSLNTGVAFVARKLGNERFSQYFLDFGLGEETGVDLPGEIRGIVSNLKSSRELEHATASYGQGIAITPMETVRALSALGNGGTLVNPHIVKKINYTVGLSKAISFPEGRQVIKPETSEEITRMLVKVVDDALLGGTVKISNYSIAAKTGTAQIASPAGGYYGDRYLHSFFGYFPAYHPKFLVFLYTIEPQGASFASHTLTLPFMDIAKFLINYYEVPPDR